VIFTESGSNPLVSLGAGGAYDSNDCNDPNLVFDTPNNRWVMYYSAYNGAKPQSKAFAFATSIGGPYTKNAGNPAFQSSDSTSAGEDGGLVFWNNLWWSTYGRSNDNKIGMATSPDLVTWTDRGEVLPLNCPGFSANVSGSFLRITQDGSTMQLWYAVNSGNTIGFVTSTDGVHFTKGAQYQFLTEEVGLGQPNQIYSVHAYVPPGKEGKEYLVSVDHYTWAFANERVITQYVTIDGGQTWHSRYAALAKSGAGWESNQVFDA